MDEKEKERLDGLIHYATDAKGEYPFEVTGEDLELVLQALLAYRASNP